MCIAVYPGTFDPIHVGHIDIARRAAQIFDRLVVGIYDQPNKRLLFPVEERLALAREAFAGDRKIDVASYSDLTVDFCRRQGAQVIVRGLRVISDFELEYQMALMNRRMAPDIEMVCLMTGLEHAFVSSSIVKEIARAGGPITDFVPEHVALAVEARLRSQP